MHIYTIVHVFLLKNLSKLHLCPELNEVNHKECDHNDAEHKHILGRPFHSGSSTGNGILVITTCTTVLKREPKSVEDVNDKESCKPHGCYKSVPVGSEKFAHSIIAHRPEQRDTIHQAVKRDK
jgi:hypothetical protein